MDHLGLVKAIDRLRQGVVITVANTPDRRLDPGLGEALGIFDRHILATAIAVVDQPATVGRTTIMDGLLERIQDEARMRRPADPPTHDIAGINVDDEGHINEACPCRDIGKVRHPELLGAGAWNCRFT